MIHMWEKRSSISTKWGCHFSRFHYHLVSGILPRHSEMGDAFDKQIAEVENAELDSKEKNGNNCGVGTVKEYGASKELLYRNDRTNNPASSSPIRIRLENECQLIDWYGSKEVVVSTLSVLYTGDEEDSQGFIRTYKTRFG